jgi:DNA polymerase-3 subunit epsilon
VYASISILATGQKVGKDKILEISIVPFSQEDGIGTPFSTHLNPQQTLTPEQERFIRIGNDQAGQAPHFYSVAKQIIQLTSGKTLVTNEPRFVYSFLKKEFKELGFTWQAKFLPIEKLIPAYQNDMPALSRVQTLPNALALAERVLQYLPSLTSKKKHSQADALLPIGITSQLLASLPPSPGVYYFKNKMGTIIYVGKSKNIRSRVRTHFQIDIGSKKSVAFKSSIASIEYKETGTELLALLLESDEIKRHQPRFNTSLVRKDYRFGIEPFEDENGYLQLRIAKAEGATPLSIPVSSKMAGQNILAWLVESYSLCQKLCSLYKSKAACFDYMVKKCDGACIGLEEAATYNARVTEALNHFALPYPTFMVIDKGRTDSEKSVVWVSEQLFLGYGYVDMDVEIDPSTIAKHIKPKSIHRDALTILRSFLANSPEASVIRF